MRLYGLRLLVSLLTFGVGVVAASLFGSGPARHERRVIVVDKPVLVAAPAPDAPPPPPRACSYIVSGGVLNEKAVSRPVPQYPPEAKAAGVVGTVVVQVVIDESGRVTKAEAVSGPVLLQDAAVEAAQRAEFPPTLLSGRPVKVSGLLTYKFRLE